MISRRVALAGAIASVPALAEARLEQSSRPKLRGDRDFVIDRQGQSEGIVAAGRVSGQVSFALRDLSNGQVVEAYQGDLPQPPASVAKVPTALYALSTLGAGYRFKTQIVVAGTISGGRLRGDLYLVGGGDPHLDSDGLDDLARSVAKAGITAVDGAAYVVDAALPYAAEIDPDQPSHVGYNPAISGINLNFNRVHFQWSRNAQGYATRMTARSANRDPAVSSIGVSVVNRQSPVFTYSSVKGRDQWSVAAQALGRNGSRWLPVRACTAYVGDVFQTLARDHGVRIPAMRAANRVPAGKVIASTQSAPLEKMLVSMLKYSTNLTAEVAGLRASVARAQGVSSLAQSGRLMTDWMRLRYGLGQASLVNHSGLTAASRLTAGEMVQFLDIAAQESTLPDLLKDIPLAAAEGQKARMPGISVRAKTGTLNFTRALAGYLTGKGGKRMAFAIFSSNLPARRAAMRSSAERPQGASAWRRRALAQERALLRQWAKSYL